LTTERLTLRAFSLDDAPEVTRLAGDEAIASTTVAIPHPYEERDAVSWIETHEDSFAKGTLANFAITLRNDGALLGAIGMTLSKAHRHAELGFWMGKEYWNCGYTTEAARAVLRHGFADLGLNRIFAHHFTRNPASGRVLEKIGMMKEGLHRQHVRKGEQFEDIVVYGILGAEFASD
ncbi:MAG: GNAT family N-acetyltransferase, partial [Planctomycetota bacterium]